MGRVQVLLRWFDNVKMKRKLVGSFVIGSLVGVVIGVLGLMYTSEMSSAMSDLYNKQMRQAANLSALSTALQDLRVDLSLMLHARNTQERGKVQARALERKLKLRHVLMAVENYVSTREEQNVLTHLRAGIAAIDGHVAKAIEFIGQMRTKEAKDLLFGGIDETLNQIRMNLDKLDEINARSAASLVAQNEAAALSATWSIGLMLILGISSALAWGMFVANTVSRPISTIMHAIDAADLNTTFSSNRADEIGDMLRSLDKFVGTIRRTIEKLVEISVSIAQASSDISASTDVMALGAGEQSARVTEVSGSVEQMSKTILDNSRNASVTAESARTAKKAAAHGGMVVQETVSGMRRIADVVKQSAEGVRTLGCSSDQIGEIVLVIEDIANQTNLLALNAAIEAARAGEQGRGFAVVADEVRKLAERTTKATKEIAERIGRIQKETAEAVRSMEAGTKEVNAGIELADAAGSSLKEIVNISQTVTDMIIQIASASKQQAATSEEIAKSVVQISSVTRENAGGIQQIVKTTGDLRDLTVALRAITGQFNLGETGTKAPHVMNVNDTKKGKHMVVPIANVEHHLAMEVPATSAL